jgi:microcystin degradation protein MlrC
MEAVPVFAARAVPFGAITAETYDTLLTRMFAALEQVGPLDGILVAPHGATVSEAVRDADGHWLSELRSRVGEKVPILGTLDPHANLSPQMVAATNALIAYRTNPHLDQRARGIEAATLMARTLRGEIRPVQAASFPPMAINIERQLTSEPQCRPLYELADDQLRQPRVLSNSILLGFPYADVEEMGSAALAVADDSQPIAEACAAELGRYLWSHRHDFVGQLIGIEEALQRAAGLEGPVCLLDMGDNVGGGSPGDSTHLIHAMRRHGLQRAFVCLCDPAAVQQATQTGTGKSLRMAVGGHTDRLHGEPFEDAFTVLGIYDGTFHEPQPRHGGFTYCDQGPTAVVRGESGITVMLTTRRMPPFSLRQLTTFNVQPSAFHLLVAKGVNAPVAAYEPVCRHLIRVNTPGCTTADMRMLEFHHRRRPMFPFESD